MRTTTGTHNAIDMTYNYEITYPDDTVFVYSRHMFIRLALTDESGAAVAGRKIQCTCLNNINGQSLYDNIMYTDSKGYVTFDLAKIAQAISDKPDKELTKDDMTRLWSGGLLIVRLFDTRYYPVAFSFSMENGAHDPRDKWRMEPVRLKAWSSYPFTLDLPAAQNISFTDATGNGFSANGLDVLPNVRKMARYAVPLNSSKFARDRYVVQTVVSTFDFAIDKANLVEQRQSVILEIDKCKPTSDRAYLRWLGSHGEVFFWLFYKSNKTVEFKSELYSDGVTIDNMTYYNGYIRDVTRSESISLYSELLSRYYYDIVSEIGGSPCVDLYVDGEWQRVDVEDYNASEELKYSDNAKLHRVTFSIKTRG